MKLVRYGAVGKEKPGVIDSDGNIRDLSKKVPDVNGSILTSDKLKKLNNLNIDRLPLVKGKKRLGVPVSGIGKVVCIGLNYVDHAKETGSPIPSEPIMFMKPTSSLSGPNDEVMLPKGLILGKRGTKVKDSTHGDWEVELGIVIGNRARSVSMSRALSHVAGYTLVNDVSEREYQMKAAGGQWIRGKGFDTSCPVGPWMVTRDEVRKVQDLDLWLNLNGKRMQTGNTSTMIFDVKTIVSYVSHYMTLEPGDLIATGTPPGVGAGMKPQKFLKHGDEMHLGIDKLGEQCQKVVKWK